MHIEKTTFNKGDIVYLEMNICNKWYQRKSVYIYEYEDEIYFHLYDIYQELHVICSKRERRMLPLANNMINFSGFNRKYGASHYIKYVYK